MGVKWDRFEKVVIVGCWKYQDRLKLLSDELARIGLKDKAEIHLDFKNPFVDYLQQHLPLTPLCRKAFRCGYNHYCIIKEAYEAKVSSILIMEDDIRFLKDVTAIQQAVDTLPNDYHLALFDTAWPQGDVVEQKGKTILPQWRTFNKLFSGGCYAMSTEGMARFLKAYEDGAFVKKSLLSNDQYYNRASLGEDTNLYHFYPNVAIQTIVGDNGYTSDMVRYYKNHTIMGLNLDAYNTPSKLITKDNFVSELQTSISRSVQTDKIVSLESIYDLNGNSLPPVLTSYFASLSKITTLKEGVPSIYPIWGNGVSQHNQTALIGALSHNKPILLCEDGFIRSYDTWCANTSPKLKVSHSLLIDRKGYYFDATRPTTIEQMLNDKNLVVTEKQKEEARRLIRRIVENKISKYNHQPIFSPLIGRQGKRKVLVVDQSYGDYSIRLGLADNTTFEKMIKVAIEENGDADILVKTHPDTLAGRKGEKKGYYQDIKEHDNIYKVTFPINPFSLMNLCDKVYVCSSQFGLEALMAGKEVHTFGMPFYAGWGLTIDEQHLTRRTNKRSLEELFYIFYCMYTHWIDPEKRVETTIDAVIDKMIELRNKHLDTICNDSIPIAAQSQSILNNRGADNGDSAKILKEVAKSNIIRSSRHSRGFVGKSSSKGWNW